MNDSKITHLNEIRQINHLAICIPVLDKPHMLFSQDLSVMMYRLGVGRFPTLLIHESGSFIPKVRNRLIAKAFAIAEQQKITIGWFLLLDCDMRFPGDLVQRLMAHNKAIIGCTYVRRTPPFDCLGRTMENSPRDVKNESSLIEMAALPTGCLLVRAEVFAKLKKPYFFGAFKEETSIGANDEQEFGEDYSFCAKARTNGQSLWLDPQLSKEIGHVSEKTLYPEADSWPQLPEAVNG